MFTRVRNFVYTQCVMYVCLYVCLPMYVPTVRVCIAMSCIVIFNLGGNKDIYMLIMIAFIKQNETRIQVDLYCIMLFLCLFNAYSMKYRIIEMHSLFVLHNKYMSE